MASNDGVEQLPQLSAAPAGSPGSSIDEKAEIRGLQKRHSSDSSLDHKEKLDEKEDPYAHDSEVVYVRGEPVISNGRDVLRFLVDTRDDGDPAITFRSLFIGTVFAGLGAALYQVRDLHSHLLIAQLDDVHFSPRYICSSLYRWSFPLSSSC